MNPSSVVRKVVHFHHLHDSKPPKNRLGPDADGNYEYLVEGKARPMLVIAMKDRLWLETAENTRESSGINDCTLYRTRGKPGFLVLSLQSEPPPSNVPSRLVRNLLPDQPVSYVELHPVCYPEESVARDGFESIPEGVFDYIIGEMVRDKLGYPYQTKWHRA